MSKLEQVFYSAVGELTGIWVTINGERYLFSKESIIREQIAKEIEAISYWGYEEYGIRYISQPDAAVQTGDRHVLYSKSIFRLLAHALSMIQPLRFL